MGNGQSRASKIAPYLLRLIRFVLPDGVTGGDGPDVVTGGGGGVAGPGDGPGGA